MRKCVLCTTHGLAPVCSLMWDLSAVLLEKVALQTWQLTEKSTAVPSWRRLWTVSVDRIEKLLWQTSHVYGFSPVCTRMWRVRSLGFLKPFRHTVHLLGRSDVFSTTWNKTLTLYNSLMSFMFIRLWDWQTAMNQDLHQMMTAVQNQIHEKIVVSAEPFLSLTKGYCKITFLKTTL